MAELKKLGLIFPGQATHVAGMEIAGFLKEHPEITESVLGRADQIFSLYDADGNPILKDENGQPREIFGAEGSEKAVARLETFSDVLLFATTGDLAQTRLNQPAITTHGMIVMDCLRKLYPDIDFAGAIGNSVGEYSAYYAAGVLTAEDTLRLIATRAEAMQAAVDQYTKEGVRGMMKVVMGLDSSQLEAVIGQLNDEWVSVGGILTPQMATLSGKSESVERAAEQARAAGANKIIDLPTGSGAYHSNLMGAALDPMRSALEKTNFQSGKPVYANFEGQPVDLGQIPKSLLEQITGTVRLGQGLQAMESDGFGRVLGISAKPKEAAQYVSLNTGMQSFNISSAADLNGSGLRDFLGIKTVFPGADFGGSGFPMLNLGKERRVVVTGLGFVGPTGMNVDTAWENAKNGVSGVQKLTSADLPFADLGIDLAAALPGREKNKILNFDSLSPFEQQEHAFESLFPSRVGGIIDHAAAVDLLAREVRKKKPDLFVTYALIAAQQALDSSGLLNDAGILNLDNPFRAGVSFGSGIGGLMSTEKGIFDGILKGSKLALAGNFLPGMLPNMATGWIADQYRLAGISTAPNGACASGGQAIEDAFRYIKGGILDVSVAGAAEAALSSMMALRAFGLAALATGWEDDPTAASRPYDLKRNGFVIAEGAGALLLEDLAHAERRGAEPLAEIVSIGGSTCNPGSEGSPLTSGTVVGQRNSIQMALAMAGVSPDEIGWIKAHGTSTTVGDQIESRSITSAVRPDVPVTSLKSMIGHALGASLAQEVVLMVRALQSGVIPPTINLGEQDPQCKAQVVRELTRSDAQYALANTFGFGGVNRSVTLKRIA